MGMCFELTSSAEIVIGRAPPEDSTHVRFSKHHTRKHVGLPNIGVKRRDVILSLSDYISKITPQACPSLFTSPPRGPLTRQDPAAATRLGRSLDSYLSSKQIVDAQI